MSNAQPTASAKEPSNGASIALCSDLLAIVKDKCGAENAVAVATGFKTAIDRACTEKDKEIAELNGRLDGVCADAVKRSSEKDDLLLQVLTTRQQLAATEIRLSEFRRDFPLVSQQRNEAQAHIIELREALQAIRDYGTKGKYGLDAVSTARAALIKTAASYSGLTTIKVTDLAELRKDGERLETVINMMRRGKSPMREIKGPNGEGIERYVGISEIVGIDFRASIDAAMHTTVGNGRAEG